MPSMGALSIKLQLVRSRWNRMAAGVADSSFGFANMGISAPAPPRQLR